VDGRGRGGVIVGAGAHWWLVELSTARVKLHILEPSESELGTAQIWTYIYIYIIYIYIIYI